MGELIADGPPLSILCHPKLQVESSLPAPTLISLSQQLQLEQLEQLEQPYITPLSWVTNFLNQSSLK